MRNRIIALLMVLCLALSFVVPAAFASETEDDAVSAVVAQLEAIDTLKEMQDKRSEYTASNHYDINTTNENVIAAHEEARAGYEDYVAKMFAARLAAQEAYDALTDEQKAQIDSALVAKLSNDLPTVFKTPTYEVTPADDEYTFEAVEGGAGQAYEVGNHMVSGQIPQTFILVDTSNGETSWTPSGKYVFGESNYDVAYCCDVQTNLEYTTDYKRVNLEDSNYYGPSAARHIRAILQNAYPFVSIDEMKSSLKAGGLGSEFVDSLTRADIISAVQMAVWSYANAGDGAEDGLEYYATVDVPKNTGIYFTPLHDYTNELWDWLPGKKQRTFDARAAYRVNNLAYYLCNLPGVEAEDDQIVISNVEVTRADLVPGADNLYDVGMYVYLNEGGGVEDSLKVNVVSYHTNESGETVVTAKANQVVGGRETLSLTVKAQSGDTIKVTVEGTQTLAKGVYFYEPEGGRDVSQSLVGVAEGKTDVYAEKEFKFVESVGEMGLRIYKSAEDTDLPISEIAFSVYRVVLGEGEQVSELPTEEEITKYKTEENKVGTITTDATGYASITLEEGTYLVIEEPNTEKVEAPVAPFYIQIPMTQQVESEDGSVVTEQTNIVSVYPKNTPVIPPEEPPVIPPTPGNVTGQFEIVKHDEADSTILLEGAQFEVYRAATADDTDTKVITCDGVQYAVVPVTVNGETLVLTTGVNGYAASPELTCGTYFLVEVKAPSGYNLLDEAVSVTVVSSEMTSVTTVEIGNSRGTILPETGGMGTTWFWAIGSFMTIAAVVLLMNRRRMITSR